MDLSSAYRQLVRRYFPNAKIVADRFHVIRLLHHFFLKTYQTLDPAIKYHRGLLGALRIQPEKLTASQRQTRQQYLKQQPVIAATYRFQQQLYHLLMEKHCKAKKCKRLIPLFLKIVTTLKQQPFQALKTLGKTLYQGREEIAYVEPTALRKASIVR